MNDGHVDDADGCQQCGRPIAARRVFERRTQRRHTHIEKQQDEFRREPWVPRPIGSPHRPAPQRTGDQRQNGERRADGCRRRRHSMSHFDAPDERDGTGCRHDRIYGQGQHCGRHVHVYHAKGVALLVVGGRNGQSVDQPISQGKRCGTQEPRHQRGRGPVYIGWRGKFIEPGPHSTNNPHSSVMRSATVAANGASVQVNTQSAAKKYNAPAALVPDIARSVAPAPKIKSGMASGSTMSESSTLPRFNPTVRPAPMAPNQLKVKVPNIKLNIMVGKTPVGMLSAVPTTGDTKTSAAPLTSQ